MIVGLKESWLVSLESNLFKCISDMGGREVVLLMILRSELGIKEEPHLFMPNPTVNPLPFNLYLIVKSCQN